MSVRVDQEEAETAHVPHWRRVEPIVLDSLHGTHQLHRFVGRWSDGEVGEWAVLTDKATAAAVLDMAGIRTGDAVWRADGRLLVRLKGSGDARLLIVDVEAGTFRRIGYDQTGRPIAELQAAVMQSARQVGADGRHAEPENPWLQRDFSPDGQVMVEYAVQTQRMSHETRTPRIVDVASGDVLLDLEDGLYDGSVTWTGGGRLSVYLRHYAMGGGMAVEIDSGRRTWMIPGEAKGERPLATINDQLPRRYRALCDAQPRLAGAAASIARRQVSAVGIVVAIVLIVGGIMLVAWATDRPAHQKLTPMPTFTATPR